MTSRLATRACEIQKAKTTAQLRAELERAALEAMRQADYDIIDLRPLVEEARFVASGGLVI